MSGRQEDTYQGVWSQTAAWWAFLAGCATLPWISIQVASVPVSDLFYAAAAYLVAFSPGRHRCRPSTALVFAAFAALTATVLASLQTDPANTGASLATGLRIVWLFSIWVWTIRRLVHSSERAAAAAWAYCAGAAVSAGWATWQVYATVGLSSGRADGLTGHVNDAGGSLAVAVAFAAVFSAQRRRRVLAGAALAAAATGLMFSGSITGTTAAMSAIITVVVLHRVRVRVLVVVAAGMYVAWRVAARLPDAVNPLSRLSDATSTGPTGTLRLRVDTWRYAWDGIVGHPWAGVGLDPTSGGTVVFRGVTTTVLGTHNALLLAWYQGGLLLLAGSIVVMIGAFRRVTRAGGLHRDLVAAAGIAAVVFGATAPIQFQRYYWLPILMAYALPAAVKPLVHSGPAQADPTRVSAPRTASGATRPARHPRGV